MIAWLKTHATLRRALSESRLLLRIQHKATQADAREFCEEIENERQHVQAWRHAFIDLGNSSRDRICELEAENAALRAAALETITLEKAPQI